MQEAQQGSAMMANMATKTNITQLKGPDLGVNAQFPVQLSSSDRQDDEMALRQTILKDKYYVEGQGIAVVGDDYWAYAKRKMDDQQEAAFKTWVLSQANLEDPAQAAWWFRTVPWLKSSREEVINYSAELQKRAAMIALNGPQNEDDFRFLFMMQNGLIKLPDKPLQEIYKDEGLIKGDSYVKGFFSPTSQKLLKDKFPPIILPEVGGRVSVFPWSAPVSNAKTAGKVTADNAFFSRNPNPLGK